MLALSDEDVERACTVAGAVEVLRAVYEEAARAEAVPPERLSVFHGATDSLRILGAVVPVANAIGFKAFHRVGDEVRYLVHLIELATGEPLALLDANRLTVLRTAATAGVAAAAVMPDARRLGVIGSGAEAQTQAEAIASIAPIEEIRVHSPRHESRERFRSVVSSRTGARVVCCDEPREVVEPSEVVVVATNTKGRGIAFEGEWLEDRRGERTHVSSIGSTLPNQMEVDPETWRIADHVIVDSLDVLEESGDAIRAAKAGTLDRSRVTELSRVCAGDHGRTWGGITFYKSIGSAIQDVGMARHVYDQAVAQGIGQRLPPFQGVRHL